MSRSPLQDIATLSEMYLLAVVACHEGEGAHSSLLPCTIDHRCRPCTLAQTGLDALLRLKAESEPAEFVIRWPNFWFGPMGHGETKRMTKGEVLAFVEDHPRTWPNPSYLIFYEPKDESVY